MGKRFRTSRPRKMNPVFFVFCEGETEKAYCELLRRHFRIPVQTRTIITGLALSSESVRRYLKEARQDIYSAQDRIFLMFDADVPELLHRTRLIKDTIPVISNPCIELWFLLHYQNQTGYITCADCVRKVKIHNPDYKKGNLNLRIASVLEEQMSMAIARAEKLQFPENPSSSLPLMILEFQAWQQAEKTGNIC